ncbi:MULTISPECIES: dehydrogenase [unclassified Cryobacterium]|uniref:dehydrogenase n=1 Tax=unclassified Cryobacterium TaxID=2649013 RepID=UPI002AB4D05F|nr:MULTISPECIES: dehydrogenase [unclassified Cryobacterium]MDY7542447.1 dehydrogenase [Cryobacterium sp. 5B3]MEB0001108.1 dehydrogenase [Cryobacterium sp. RTS3]MEB0267740.1 dehydrogenase [Cryobacterium sp. 10I5]MEB0276757.1 dehydrogenase [Cryobacterium sp. 5B3]
MNEPTDPTDPTDMMPPTRSVALAAALADQDVAAVAYALRNDVVIVPQLVVNGQGEQVRVFGREGTDKRMLLLFSSAENYVRMVPDEVDPQVMVGDAQWLRDFLTVHRNVLEMVFFDIAGPHVMQAAPDDLMAALGTLPETDSGDHA